MLTSQPSEALTVIVDEVKEIDRHIDAIVEAAREQATALQEINTAVNTMDQGTQQNATMGEESTAASHSLVQENQPHRGHAPRIQYRQAICLVESFATVPA
ncbi:hypothetical protein EPK84_01010 (plasmid) [Sinorhizobium fredii]|nr:hypothetical protein [Sinorhizobium fredii]UTY45570.1 hypothetical protein EPK84_01010 [Sinorhizobium fredii]